MIFVIPSPKVDAVAVVDDLALVLLATLAAFGISFTAAGGIDDVGPWVVDQFESFVSFSGYSVSSVLEQLRYGVNKAGDLVGNAYALSFNARFAQWLQTEYSLSDNSSLPISDVSLPSSFVSVPYYFGNDPSGVLQNGKLFYFSGGSPHNSWYITTTFSSSPVYAVWIAPNFPNLSGAYRFFFTLSPNSSAVTFVVDTDRLSWSDTYSMSNRHGPFFYKIKDWGSPTDLLSYGGSSTSFPVFSSLDSLYSVLDSSVSSLIVVNTGSIDIPQVGDYSDQDGILIDGLGSWGDTLQDVLDRVSGLTLPDVSWPTVSWGAELADQLVDSLVSVGTLTTEDSPGFYNGLPLIGGIPDIQFGSLWHYVTDWVGSMSSGLSLIGGIMFSLPFVAAFYALVVILLVLSLWRLLRSA